VKMQLRKPFRDHANDVFRFSGNLMIPFQGLLVEILGVTALFKLWPPQKAWWILAALLLVNLIFCRALSTHIREAGDPRGLLLPINLIQFAVIILSILAFIGKL